MTISTTLGPQHADLLATCDSHTSPAGQAAHSHSSAPAIPALLHLWHQHPRQVLQCWRCTRGFKSNRPLSPLLGSHTSLLSTNSKTRLSSQGSKEKQHREGEMGEEQHGEPGPGLARQGPASRAMPPRAAGRRSPPTRFRGHRPQCQGIFPHAYPSCSSPVPAQSMPRQTGSGPRPDTDDRFF